MEEFLLDPEDGEFQFTQSNEALSEVSEIANNMAKLASDIADLEEQLKEKKTAYYEISRGALPAAMQEIGLSVIGTDTGDMIMIQDLIEARIPKDRKAAAFAWIEEHGHGDILNHSVVLDFKKGSEQAVEKLRQLLSEQGYPFRDERDIHWKRLESFVKELIANEAEDTNAPRLPRDLFGVYEGKIAKIERK